MMNKKKKKLRWFIPIALIVLMTGGFFVYTSDYYHADAEAEAAMVSDENVRVVETDYGWLFDGGSHENALIFYPGGKVEETAYAPLCKKLAQSGIDACLVKMPFRLAFFGVNKAEKIIGSMDYDHWYIAGHSLGGVFAAAYAADHANDLHGVILLAAYTTKELDEDLTTMLIYGSEDGVLNMENYRKNMENVPTDSAEHVIEGGNHAQFGSYGVQEGDGTALISQAQQVEETVSFIVESIHAA